MSSAGFATVGLGGSDFGYRIFALLVSVASMHGFEAWIRCMDPVHKHGQSEGKAGDSVPWRVRICCFFHYNCSLVNLSLSESPSEALLFSPAKPCLYVYIATYSLQVYME